MAEPPDAVVDQAVAAFLWMCGLCGDLDALVAVVLALAFAFVSWGLTCLSRYGPVDCCFADRARPQAAVARLLPAAPDIVFFWL